jgi:UDP-glucose 4-epimerase
MRIFVAGSCGFIGSQIVHRLLRVTYDCEIIAFDNLSSGKLWYLDDVKDDPRLHTVLGDLKNLDLVIKNMVGCDVCYAFASNALISKAESDPSLDFFDGTLIIQNILEAMRINRVKRIIYASGSGVYGDSGYTFVDENSLTGQPISPYGASKLSCEALISAYSNMFPIIGRCYRFCNVIGKYSTHSCILDFIDKLILNPKELVILGSGQQTKAYGYVDDILDAVFVSKGGTKKFNVFNVSTSDYITVQEIANLVIGKMGLRNVERIYTGGDRGWRGDVPVIRMATTKIRFFGWQPKFTTKEAVERTIGEILELKGYKI